MHEPVTALTDTLLTTEFLRSWPLPLPSAEGDKEQRGRVLIIGGSHEVPGATILAGEAALRAGAGKVTIATNASIANLIATSIPESRVIELPDSGSDGFAASAAKLLDKLLKKADAVLIGPGMQDEFAACDLVRLLLPTLDHAKVLLDAYAMGVVRKRHHHDKVANRIAGQSVQHPRRRDAIRFIERFKAPVLLTPHAGEMAHLTGVDKESVQADPRSVVKNAAQIWGTVVALKGGTTFIAAPDGRIWCHEGGNSGLAVSGSGDVLSGIIAGLSARGASLEQACAWGVALHALAGEQLAARTGPLGFLMRDLAAEVPMLMHGLQPR